MRSLCSPRRWLADTAISSRVSARLVYSLGVIRSCRRRRPRTARARAGGLPPHASLVTPRPKKTIPLLHTLAYLHGSFRDSQAAHHVLDGVSTMRRGGGHSG